MILLSLLLILIIAGIVAGITGRFSAMASRCIALIAIFANLIIVLALWLYHPSEWKMQGAGDWALEFSVPWVPQFGIHFSLAIDGLSLLLIALSMLLGLMSVLASWTEIKHRVGFFHFNLLWVLAGIVGVFMAMDLFLFYFFWELMLIPMYFLIAIWGHEHRFYAAYKFFIYTQVGGLFMLMAIIGLFFTHGLATGNFTYDYRELIGAPIDIWAARWLFWGFLLGFLVKIPAVPIHNWLPDAHTEAPTAGSVILAGLLLKTGAYGVLRFAIPLFPIPAREYAPILLLLGIIGIIYGAILAFSQSDFKRLVAYTSISHMGFVIVGLFSFNIYAYQGAVMQMVTHGISTSALFILAGLIQKRLHTRDLNRMGGLWSVMPQMSAVTLLFVMASLGLPGLGNFVAEFLVLLGAYQVNWFVAALATSGLIFATLYSLRILQKTCYGPNTENWKVSDLNMREWSVFIVLIVAIVWLGLYPQPVLEIVRPTLDMVLHDVGNGERLSMIGFSAEQFMGGMQ